MRKGQLQFLLINLVGSFQFGFSFVFFNACSSYLLQDLKIPQENYQQITGQLTSLIPLGAIFGCILCNILLKFLSKRQQFILIDIIEIIAPYLLMSGNLFFFQIARTFQGINVGFSTVLTLKFALEYTLYEDYNLVIGFNGIIMNFGIVIASILSVFMPLTYIQNDIVFKIMVLTPGIASFIRLLATLTIYQVDSPIDCQKKGIDIRKSLQTLYRDKKDIEQFLKENESKKNNQNSVIVKNTGLFYLGIFLMIFQNLAGINAIGFYTNIMFYKIYPDVMTTRYLSLIFVLLGAVASLIYPNYIRKYGFKGLLLIGCQAISLILFVLAGSSYLYEQNVSFKYLRYLCCALILFYNFMFSLTLGPTPWGLCGSKLSDSQMVYVGLSSWVSTTIISYIFPQISQLLGMPVTFGLFSISTIMGLLIIIQFLDDDKKKIK